MIPLEKVKNIISKHSKLEVDLSSSNIDKKKFADMSKEYSDLNEIIDDAKFYTSFDVEKKELEKIINDKSSDKDMIELANNELSQLTAKIEKVKKKLVIFLLPKDEADKKNAILEIRAGTGGLEASLFAADLFKMYEKICNNKKWFLEIISISKSEAGGLKEVIASIKGKNIYSTLKYESGVHRVQRVPETETQGRVHTSAATVAVLPEAEEIDVKIEEKDLRIDVFRSSGPGGQSVNTTDSAVRITHIPTGIVVSQQDEKSQIRNKEKGLKILRSRIYEYERKKKEDERSKYRKSKIGTGDRSEIGTGQASGTKLNIPLPVGANDGHFQHAWTEIQDHLESYQPEFIILQCGADSLAGDPITQLELSEKSHHMAAKSLSLIAEKCCQGKLVALGGGGYNLDNIAKAWTAIVEGLID